jgi:hypothetical protein
VTKTDDLRRGVELAIAGDWDEAHEIAQRHEGDATAELAAIGESLKP